jgi:hypothetical protein
MASSNGTIPFSLKVNRLRGQDVSPFMARVRSYKTMNREELIAEMAGMNASVSRQEIIVVLDLMKAVIKKYLLSGFRVNTDLFNAKLSVKGGFDSEEDEFDPNRHTVHVRMAPAADLKNDVVTGARMEKVRDEEPEPKLDRVYDFETRSKNGTVSPGHLAEAKGANLDYDGNDEAQGVWFVDASNTGVKAKVVHKVSGSAVLFKIPELAPGPYRLIVRRAFGSEIREGTLKAELSVN